MARPRGIEFAGALYHITSRGDRREAIYEDYEGSHAYLDSLGEESNIGNATNLDLTIAPSLRA
jgi:putative transposase